jgi:tetratricopeptide (TPR) repeat protein
MLLGAHEALVRCQSEAALEMLDGAAALEPGHPATWVYRAAAWSELASRNGDDGLRPKVAEAAARAVELGEAIDDRAATPLDLFFLGEAYGILGMEHGEKKEYLRAARLGKKMRQVGREALRRDGGLADAHLLTGTYDYLAAELPGIIKVLRFFLFLPGGDKERGLASLERALEAEGFGARAAGALLQKALLYEKQDERAIRIGEELLRRRDTDGPALLMLAKTLLRAGEEGRAASLLERAAEEEALTCLYPDDRWEAAMLRGVALLNGGHAEAAMEALDRLDQAGPPPDGVPGWMKDMLQYSRAAARDSLGLREEAAGICRDLAGKSYKQIRSRAESCAKRPIRGKVPIWLRI